MVPSMLVTDFGDTLSWWQCWVTVVLVTSLCWWLYNGDWFQMLIAESLCWRFSQCIKSVTNISNLSPTHFVSNIRHQHRCSLHFYIAHPRRAVFLSCPCPTRSVDLSGSVLGILSFIRPGHVGLYTAFLDPFRSSSVCFFTIFNIFSGTKNNQ